MKELLLIEQVNNGNLLLLKDHPWLKFLALSKTNIVNYEKIDQINQIDVKYSLKYVYQTLQVLSSIPTDLYTKEIVKEVLLWSEVAKTGNDYFRNLWIRKGFNLSVHNIGSAEIYQEYHQPSNHTTLISTLIKTHGLIGQYLRGEVLLEASKDIYDLLQKQIVTKEQLEQILKVLNQCIIETVSKNLWTTLEQNVIKAIDSILSNHYQGLSLKERLCLLRNTSIQNGENYELAWNNIQNDMDLIQELNQLLSMDGLWYVEAALHDFSFEEFIKILRLSYASIANKKVRHISFERLMRNIYYDHQGKKKVNLYKKRIIEKYLSEYPQIESKIEIHVSFNTDIHPSNQIAFIDFKFSPTSSKLIEFCELSENADVLYEKAVVTLFDMFELRKDQFDRFYNEESYLDTMNQSIHHKSVILEHLVGKNILDVGPGGGALMDMIEKYHPDLSIHGIDISHNVIDSLLKRKNKENHRWNVVEGDAFHLEHYYGKGSLDTIIFSSIIHELFSYIEYEGKKFNYEVIKNVLKSAFDVLAVGGRIIIRDGIMTEQKNEQRIIKFLSSEGLRFLENYANDFQGRKIVYSQIGHNEVLMTVNDAMEFLYTYTWGEESYVHEVNEQFGYFTPNEYQQFIINSLGEGATILSFKHYLQEGYANALNTKVKIMDESRNEVDYPDSTCLIVIQKNK